MGEQGTSTRRERTRTAVLDAARARFAADGFDAATLARIAAEAGVAEPTIAHHFGSKARLLVAVMQAYYARLVDELEVVLDVPGPREQLRAFAAWWPAYNGEHWDLLAVFGRQGRPGGDPEVVTAFADQNRRVTGRVDRLLADCVAVGVLREDVPLRVLRDALFGTTEHLLLGRALTGRPADVPSAATALLDLLLHGAAPHGMTGVSATDADATVLDALRRVEAKLDTALEQR